MNLLDAHLHIRQEDLENSFLEMMEKNNLYGLVAGTMPSDCEFVAKLALKSRFIIPTYGLHPWYANQYEVSQLLAYLHDCVIIGEIGMDNVWCDIPLDKQRKAFIKQLDIAQKRKCPVILHTKGCEEEIAEIISGYSIPFIVHWYGSEEHLDKYIAQDCYFTVGPSVHMEKAMQLVVKEVPAERLFVESDGLYTIEWLTGKKALPEILPDVLYGITKYISDIKGIKTSEIQNKMLQTLNELIDIQ